LPKRSRSLGCPARSVIPIASRHVVSIRTPFVFLRIFLFSQHRSPWIPAIVVVVFAAGFAALPHRLWPRPLRRLPSPSSPRLRFRCLRPGFAADPDPAMSVLPVPRLSCSGCFVSGALFTQPPTPLRPAGLTNRSQKSVGTVGIRSPYAIRWVVFIPILRFSL
jgi:hypothetical protein